MNTTSRERVAILLYPGCISFEVALAAELLSEKFDIVNATPDGKNLASSSGLALSIQASYEDVEQDDFAAYLVPGGDPRSLMENEKIDRILRKADQNRRWIGAICAGPSVLAKAGILRGRRSAHGYGPEQLHFLKEIFDGVELTNDLFTADSHILTAKPDGYIDFAVELSSRMGVIDAGTSGRVKDYYRGLRGRKIRPLALAFLRGSSGRILLQRGRDESKNETFYRPLGGGIEFGEGGQETVIREMREELGLEVDVSGSVGFFENIFTYENQAGHEIVQLFETAFRDPSVRKVEVFDVRESEQVIGQAVWRNLDEIEKEGAKLYPQGLAALWRALSKPGL